MFFFIILSHMGQGDLNDIAEKGCIWEYGFIMYLL